MKIVKTLCHMCEDNCGLNVYVENGKVVKVEGMPESPINIPCVKAYAIPELVHSSERLTNPLKKVDGRFIEISWDEAFSFVADKLTSIRQKYGARAVDVHVGNAFIATQTDKIIRRFADIYGTPNYTTDAAFCYLARTIAHATTCGAHIFPHYSPDTRCMIVWGRNPQESSPLQADAIQARLERGAKLVVIDPRATLLAKEAAIHAQIRPGTDCALALGMLNVIIAEGLYDKAFVDQWTIGFDKLVERVKEYSPERVEKITWIKAGMIRDMARMYATNKPASISLGVSLEHCTNGIQAIRAVTTLIAITGNIGVSGGNIYIPGLRQTSLRVKEKVTKDIPIGADYPLFTTYTHETAVTPLLNNILAGQPYPIKALLIAGGNPVLTWPNTNKVIKALEKLDLVMVVDIFMTDTAKIADIVLPGTTFLERQDLRDCSAEGIPLIAVTNRAIEPVGNSMEDCKIWVELGKRMGYEEYFPWKDTEELILYRLERPEREHPNITMDRLRQNPGGIYYAEPEFQEYISRGFNTPSGKVEIYSQTMDELGYDSIPIFHEPAESPISQPDLAEKYPLILITGAKTIAYTHSRHRNIAQLRKLAPNPVVEINSQTASVLGIADREWVKVESLRGSIKIRAKLTDDIHPKVVSIPHGWSGANVNYLTDDEIRDPISAYPAFRCILCRVVKAEG